MYPRESVEYHRCSEPFIQSIGLSTANNRATGQLPDRLLGFRSANRRDPAMYYELCINEQHVGENPVSGLFPKSSLLRISSSRRLDMIPREKGDTKQNYSGRWRLMMRMHE